jgi:hypothetical protein
LRHVVDRAVQAKLLERQSLLGQSMIKRQAAHHEKQQDRDHQQGDADQKAR